MIAVRHFHTSVAGKAIHFNNYESYLVTILSRHDPRIRQIAKTYDHSMGIKSLNYKHRQFNVDRKLPRLLPSDHA